MPTDLKAFACVNVYAFSFAHANQLKCAKSLNLHKTIVAESLFNYLKERANKGLTFLFSDALLVCDDFYEIGGK